MQSFTYSTPTKIICGKGCLYEHRQLLTPLGNKALIVTGHSSATNGSLKDLMAALKDMDISWALYDRVEENPSVECVQDIGDFGRSEQCDFVAAIGGGSPIDAGKAAAFLLKNPDMDASALYTEKKQRQAVPIIAVPTTCGTGSEVTGVFVLTNHQMKTKSSTPQIAFPQLAFLDAAYLTAAPRSLIINTGIDALAHLIESFVSSKSSVISRQLCQVGLRSFSEVKDALWEDTCDEETLFKLLIIAAWGGMAIAQTGTAIPHYLGYALTYHKQIPHGAASGMLIYEYLNAFENKNRIDELLIWLGFETLADFGAYLHRLLHVDKTVTPGDVAFFTDFAMKNPAKLKTHPEVMTKEKVRSIYLNSLEHMEILVQK